MPQRRIRGALKGFMWCKSLTGGVYARLLKLIGTCEHLIQSETRHGTAVACIPTTDQIRYGLTSENTTL